MRRATKKRTHLVHPELIGRDDREGGRWTVDDCPAERGTPRTDPMGRRMFAPAGDTEYERVIRGHELIHAKVSPADDWGKWRARGVATEQHLVACEEARVNALAQRAGFDVQSHLASGDEEAYGKRLATSGDWDAAATMAVALSGTAGFEPMVRGARSVNADLADALERVGATVTDYFAEITSDELSSTKQWDPYKLSPAGFIHTELLAEWLGRVADGDGEGDAPHDTTDKGDGPRGPYRDFGPVPAWVPLRVGSTKLTRTLSGALGKTRTASDVGRNPRRMHRFLTDRRVFDKTRRSDGGIVLIDVSGSMSLSPDDVKGIVRSAPGCTVACYSSDGRIVDGKANGDNLWVLARDGRMVDDAEIERDRPRGNCVDLPALRWAVAERGNRKRTPIVWVCDGVVTGQHDNSHPVLSRQVARFAQKHGIHQVQSPSLAVDLLKAMARGARPRPKLVGALYGFNR